MRFSVIIRHRIAEARIYAKRTKRGFCRVAAYVGGMRRMASYRNYATAKEVAERLVREIASGSQATALTAGQASDALAAFQRLDGLYRSTGRRISLVTIANESAEAVQKLKGRPLSEAVDGFLSPVASAKRVDLAKAVEQFIESRAHKTQSENGRRPQLSSGYHYIVSMWLRMNDLQTGGRLKSAGVINEPGIRRLGGRVLLAKDLHRSPQDNPRKVISDCQLVD